MSNSKFDSESERFFEDVAGDIVFSMVSDIFREFNRDFLIAKSSGFTSQQAQDMAIGDFDIHQNIADDFQPALPPTTTEPDAGVSYVLIPADFPVTGADFPVTGANFPVTGADFPVTGANFPVTGADFQFDTTDAEQAFAEMEAEDAARRERARKTTRMTSTTVTTTARCDNPPDNLSDNGDDYDNPVEYSDNDENLPFQELDDSELREYIRNQRNPNTDRKTKQVHKKKHQKSPKFEG